MKQSNILAQAERLLGKKEFNIDIDKFMQFLRSAKGVIFTRMRFKDIRRAK